MKPKQVQTKNYKPKRILAVKLGDLGDALQITPALRAIKSTYPAARIDVLTTKNGGMALQGLPYIDEIILFDKYSYDRPRDAFKPANLLRALNFFGQLTRSRYDTVIFFQHLTLAFGALKYAGVALSTLAPVRIGLDNGKHRAGFLNRRVKDEGFGAITEREYWLKLAAAIGARLAEGDSGKPELFVQSSKFKVQSSKFKIALAPGGGGYSLARRWMPIGFAEVADTLVERYGAEIIIIGTADEVGLANEICRLMRHPEAVTIAAGTTDLAESVAMLQDCDLFIGNDGGGANLASVAETPSVVIFGPTNAAAWKPFGEKVMVVQAPLDLPCRPCLYKNFELGSRYGCAPRPCLTAITPAQVIAAAEQLLKTEAIR